MKTDCSQPSKKRDMPTVLEEERKIWLLYSIFFKIDEEELLICRTKNVDKKICFKERN